MSVTKGYFLITPDDLHWRPSNLMKIPNADYLERTGSENLGARLWRLPPKPRIRCIASIFARRNFIYDVLEGTGRMRVGEETLTWLSRECGGVLVGPDQRLRQVFNDTEAEVLWLIMLVGRKSWNYTGSSRRWLCRGFIRRTRRSCRGSWRACHGRLKIKERVSK